MSLVPGSRLSVISTCGTDVTGRVRGPSDAVDGSSVVAESGHGNAGDSHVQYYHLGRGRRRHGNTLFYFYTWLKHCGIIEGLRTRVV